MGKTINYRIPDTIESLGPFETIRVDHRRKIIGPHGFYRWIDDLCPFALHRALLDEYEAWWKAIRLPRVYFVGEELKIGAVIKVGIASNPRERLRGLQTAHPHKLTLFAIEYGGRDREYTLHRRWASSRLNGEWFRVTKPILEHVTKLTDSLNDRLAELDARPINKESELEDFVANLEARNG